MKQNNKIFFLWLLLITTGLTALAQTVHNIDDPEAIESLSLEAGDTVILADGTYTTDERISFIANGSEGSPITFRPETPGGVIFTGGMKMSIGGDFLVVDGFHWKGGIGASNFIEFRNSSIYSNNSTIQNCVIDGLQLEAGDITTTSIGKHRWIVLYGTYNTVINCTFMNKSSAGALVLVELEYNASLNGEEAVNTRCDVVGHTISNNYFYKYSKIDATLSNSGDSETIRVGTSEFQNVNCGTVVSNNYFVEADGENEIITNKSANNTYTNNTFRRCRGSLVLRHGSGATVDKNYFLGEDVDGTGGIRIVDSEHTITNNYIQDCITVEDQAKWNNGITFMGGGDNNAVVCTSTSVSNGYQKSENITLNNNTIINTNAPFFYNGDKGTNDNTGIVENNLISFEAGDASITSVISEDDAGDYNDFGSTLAYTGNVFGGTTLGQTNTGFSEESIALTASGEIFTHDQVGKGADMGGFEPHTDAMVGSGIGACFLNYLGESIASPECTIIEIDNLNVAALTEFTSEGGSQTVAVATNVAWVVTESLNWVTITPASGTGEGEESVTVVVSANVGDIARSGTILFEQVDGDLSATLNVNQATQELTEKYTLINTGDIDDPVIIKDFSKEQVGLDNGTERFNYAANTLDKDASTRWAANDLEDIPSGEIKADGEYIIYDLGVSYDLGLIQLSSDGKPDAYGYQIWTSDAVIADDASLTDADFTKLFPVSDDIMLTEAGSAEFQQTEVEVKARYVKLIGFGRFDSGITERESFWTNITEIEFFGEKDSSLSTADVEDNLNEVSVYPIPAKGTLYVDNVKSEVEKIEILNLTGKIVLSKNIDNVSGKVTVPVSGLVDGLYILRISNANNQTISKKIVIQQD